MPYAGIPVQTVFTARLPLFWYVLDKRNAKLCRHRIYDVPLSPGQLKREAINSIHAPTHSLMLAGFLLLGSFQNTSWLSFSGTLSAAILWAEIWHYISHRLFHLKALHWIHAEHHKSHLNTPLTAISFSFWEKFFFNLGIIGLLALVDLAVSLNFLGVAGWYVGYLIINSYSHANFEIKSSNFLNVGGQFLASTTFHSLHHSRYTNNYGLGTRFMDRWFGTEWADYENLYLRVTQEERPLERLGQKLAPLDRPKVRKRRLQAAA